MHFPKLRLSLKALGAVIALAISGSAISAHAQVHPGYIHALHDLRSARALLLVHHDRPDILNEAYAAVHEIDHAVDEIKSAAIDDGKNINDNPPLDSGMQPRDRFQKALTMLQAAHTDCTEAEADPKAAAMRDRALKHIDAATNIVSNAIQKLSW